MSNQGYGSAGAPEPEPQPQVNPAQQKLPQGETPKLTHGDAHITGVDGITEVNCTVSFGVGTSVSMDMTIPDSSQPEAPKSFELYGSSTDSSPSNNSNNLVASSNSRPANGRLGGSGTYATDKPYYVELKFKQSGDRLLSGKVRKGSVKRNTSPSIKLD